jgi:hypothetical protein
MSERVESFTGMNAASLPLENQNDKRHRRRLFSRRMYAAAHSGARNK